MTDESINKKDNNEFITYDTAVELMKGEVEKSLSDSPSIIRCYTEHLKTSSGKFIRAISLLTCAEKKDGLIHINAVKLAAAVEILHLATLVHDDVIDNAHIRRGIITLQKKYGKRTAVICGDYLLCIALKIVSSVSGKKDYTDFDIPDYMGRLCLGELNQHINNGNLDISVYNYLKIIAGKTAALFEASFYAGAVLSEIDESSIKMYMRLGRYIGMIFQLTDDCIDFEMNEKIAKKPVQSDFEQGVITLPLIYTFKSLPFFKEKVIEKKATKNDINDAVVKSGGLNFTRIVSKKYYDKATKIIGELDINENKKSRLILILDKAFYGLKK
jgi:heptaprenyl diphosphate synthase